jgi:hypothetical protein
MLAADSQAAQITLQSASSNTCQYQGMTVTPAGDFTVSCAPTGPVTPGAGGTFALSSAGLALQVGNSSSQLVVNRSGGTTDAVTVAYAVATGTASCNTSSGTLNFANGSSASQPIAVTATGTPGTCTVTISNVATVGTATASPAPTLGSPALANVTVSAAGGGGGGNGAGCPTPPSDMFAGTVFDPPGSNTTITLVSKQIASYTLPNDPYLKKNSGTIGIGETTGTVAGSFIEVTVSKCKGVIDPTAGSCYFGSYTQGWNEMTWFFQTGPYSLSQITARNYCYAPKLDSTGAPQTWYFNVRWTYPFSQWGFGRYVFAPSDGPY